MPQWYKAGIRYQKEDEAGLLKTYKEEYLFDSISFSEAESFAHKLITTGASDFSVKSMGQMNLSDLFIHHEGEKWFKGKLIYFSVEEKSGKEKKVSNQVLVNADSIQQALDRINENMKNFLIPYEVESLALTPILDVFPYVSEEGEVAK